MSFIDFSYQKHADRKNDLAEFETWQNKESIDYWRHERMYKSLLPLLSSYPEAKWLTVGDGRFGTDAHFLESHGADVLATDISGDNLDHAVASKFISKYQIENAEKLSFPDNSFDFVLCKESYHHFPRPMIALYEFLRVSRRGVVLIEPNDHNSPTRDNRLWASTRHLWQSIKNELKRLTNREIYYNYGNYEESGNYVFTISEREMEKVALGLNLDFVAFRRMNDHYLKGVEHEKAEDGNSLFEQIKKEIRKKDARSARGEHPYGLLTALIMKSCPPEQIQDSLRLAGFELNRLPNNPYMSNH